MTGVGQAELGRPVRVGDRPVRHALVDEHDAAPGLALVVEGRAHRVRRERVVGDGDKLAHDLLAELVAHERALLGDRLGREAHVGEEVDDVGDRLGREHDGVGAGIERAGVGRALREVGGLRAERLGGEVGGVGVEERRPAAAGVRSHREHRGLRAGELLGDIDAERVDDGDRVLGRAHRARSAQARASATARRSRARPRRVPGRRIRGSPRRSDAGVLTMSEPGRPGKAGSSGATLAARTAASHAARSDSSSRRLVAATPWRLPTTARMETSRVLLGDVLVDAVVGEAGQRAGFRGDDDLGGVGGRHLHDLAGQGANLVYGQQHQRPTPTWTLRNRAGEAP